MSLPSENKYFCNGRAMHIKISEKYRPFSHQPGTSCLLPSTSLVMEIFPTRIVIRDIAHQGPCQHSILTNNIIAPITKFLVQQDLEKGCLHVEGAAKSGFFRYKIYPSTEQPGFAIDSKTPINWDQNITSVIHKPNREIERLHLGITKKQDWDLMRRRGLMSEIVPFLFALGQQTPKFNAIAGDSLLSQCQRAIQSNTNDAIVGHLQNLFNAGFSSLMVPQLDDLFHLGFTLPPLLGNSALALLSEAAILIRQIFYSESLTGEISLLPHLPPEFHSGRLLGIKVSDGSKIDLEWTKKTLRRVVFSSSSRTSRNLILQSKIDTFRVPAKEDLNLNFLFNNGDRFHFEEGVTYYFDNFR